MALEYEKIFVVIVVLVPVVFTLHDAKAHHRVIDLAKGLVVPAIAAGFNPDIRGSTCIGLLAAEVCLPSTEIRADLNFFTSTLGFRLDAIWPADDPAVAVLSAHGLRIRLERGAIVTPGVVRLLCDDPDAFAGGQRELTAPNGTRILIVDTHPKLEIPASVHAFVVQRLK
ncbi:MAG: hypothetical protein WAW79_01700, partial [Steroidobacteraceae bacterium]